MEEKCRPLPTTVTERTAFDSLGRFSPSFAPFSNCPHEEWEGPSLSMTKVLLHFFSQQAIHGLTKLHSASCMPPLPIGTKKLAPFRGSNNTESWKGGQNSNWWPWNHSSGSFWLYCSPLFVHSCNHEVQLAPGHCLVSPSSSLVNMNSFPSYSMDQISLESLHQLSSLTRRDLVSLWIRHETQHVQEYLFFVQVH